ncbi:Hypothetical protein BCD_1084 (plasmid) [Borrelia crocidurae DOU]|uniref:Uncharacterized protein n=1 Tax=Borrelia crocidurae DOU TaxID=1293575 RepID=W5SJQ9_9SPIR|nr:hypothetical protein [Borrelia crocidurae]AHH07150.1 Hypothetical protein BCD_1084 [Borrelia crocidurae DOU]
MLVNVNLSGRIELPYIPDYLRKQGDVVKSGTAAEREKSANEDAFVILEGINYGFIEELKAFQIELFQKISKNSLKEIDPKVTIDVNKRQLEFMKKIWKDNVVGFVGLFDQDNQPVTKEVVEKDAILLQDMLSNLAIEIYNVSETLKVERVSKK